MLHYILLFNVMHVYVVDSYFAELTIFSKATLNNNHDNKKVANISCEWIEIGFLPMYAMRRCNTYAVDAQRKEIML